MTIEKLYVEAFSEATKTFNTHTGVTPYLQEAAGNSIGAYTDHVVDDSFTFKDTVNLWAIITSIKLAGEVATNNEDHNVACLLSGVAGGAWNVQADFYGDGLGTYIPNLSVELIGTINSLARLNECAMKCTKHNVAGAGSLIFTRAYLQVTIVLPVTENIMDGLVQC
jgi:hypothetical protein